MAVDITQFWKLISESRLLPDAQIAAFRQEYEAVPGAGQGNAKAVAEWLVEKNVFSRYQTTILLAGRAGPFIYGDYRIYDRLADGPWAGHFRAVHGPSGQPMMLKFVTGPVSQDAQKWSRFADRVRAWSRLSHPNLRRIGEAVDLRSFKFVASDDTPGVFADELMAGRGGRLAAPDACSLILQAAQVMQEAHAAGLAHGHLRPDRLLVQDGVLQLVVDADEMNEAPRADVTPDLACRQADYMAPELMRAGKAFDVLTDVYALGCTFYHLLAGVPPFDGGDVQEKMQRHATEAIKPLDSFGVPTQVAEIVTFMMAKNAAVRLAGMQVVSQKLKAAFTTETPAAPPPPPSWATYRSLVSNDEADTAATADTPGVGPPIQLDITSESPIPQSGGRRPIRRRSVWQRNLPLLVGTLVVAAGIGIVALLYSMKSGDDDSTAQKDDGKVKQVNNGGGEADGKGQPAGKKGDKKKDAAKTTGSSRETVVSDDRLPWASPTGGNPVDLKMMPPGGQIFLVARPSDLSGSPEGKRILTAMGPAFSNSVAKWEGTVGLKLGEIEQVVMGLYDDGENFPRPAFRVQLLTPHTREALLAKWDNPSPTKHEDGHYYNAKGWSFYVPGEGETKTFLMASESGIKEVIEFGGGTPPLRRGIGPLLQNSDADRHVSILFAPNFISTALFRDGRELFFGEPRKVRQPLEWFLADNLDAGLFSFHFGEQFYWELRTHATLENDKFELANSFKKRIGEIPDQIERYVAVLNPHIYWRMVANRYPGMIRFMDRHVRVGVEANQAVVNCRLPGIAAHNLFFGGEMLLVSAPGAGGNAPVPKTVQTPKTIEELLTRTFDVDIPQNDLNLAVDEIVAGIREKFGDLPFEFQVKIIGPDLMADGITRNQSIRNFALMGKPIADVLTGLAMKGNTPAMKDPSEKKQLLIWVIAPDPANGGNKIVWFTTRKAAASKGYQLPEVFKTKE